MTLRFRLLSQPYAVARLAPADAIPAWARGELISITRTPDELSVICVEDAVPPECTATRGWRCLAAIGPFAFTDIGIAAEFTRVLADRRISVLVVSTYETDYVLVGGEQIDAAVAALVGAGHEVKGIDAGSSL